MENDGWCVSKEQSSRRLWGVCGSADFGAEDWCGVSVWPGERCGNRVRGTCTF